MKVMVVGTGPAGLLTAYAAVRLGADLVTLVAHPDAPLRSAMHGAQYLHRPPAGLPDTIEPFRIRYHYFGTEDGYREKIYGDTMPRGGSSWKKFGPLEWAWSMQEVYDFCWETVGMGMGVLQIEERVASSDWLEFSAERYDYVFNTAPLDKICPTGTYESETVLILPKKNLLNVPENEIWYLGVHEFGAYRASNINGLCSTEYPNESRYARRGVVRVDKPLRCTAQMEGVYRLGRYGKWHKGILVHDAYEEAVRVMTEGLPWTATLPA